MQQGHHGDLRYQKCQSSKDLVVLVFEWWSTLFPLTYRETIHLRQRNGTVIWSRTVTFSGRTAKKVLELGKTIDKVSLLKLVEEDREFYPVSVIVDCFGVKRSTFYCWKARGEQSEERDEVVEKIEQLCMEKQFIYSYRTISRLLKKIHSLVVNRKKVYRIMKDNGWICRTRPKKVANLGKPYYVTKNKLGRDFQADKPLEKLVADITYLYFGKCKLYLPSIMNLYNREIVAYTISDCQDTDFVLDTLSQLELPQGAILHSDQVNRLHF